MLTLFGAVLAITSIIAVSLVFREVRTKHLNIWMGAHLQAQLRKGSGNEESSSARTIHILFCVVDHFEPVAEGSTIEQERERMHDWLNRYPALARRHRDPDCSLSYRGPYCHE